MDILSYLMGQNSAIKKGMKVEVVTELPEIGQTNVIYLVPKENTEENDIFEEYLYIDDEWELIGTTDIDLSGYQTKIDSTHKLSSDLVDDTNNTNKFVTSTEKTTWGNKYDKPLTGIPNTDLTNEVQTILGKADTAEQTANKVTSLSSSSTDTEYPSAKCVYDALGNAGGSPITYVNSSTFTLSGRKKGIYVLRPLSSGGKATITIGWNSGTYTLNTISGIVYVLLDLPTNISDVEGNPILCRHWGVNSDYTTLNCVDIVKSGSGLSQTFVQNLPKFDTVDIAQTISAKKTFNVLPESSVTPTTNNQLVNKAYVDSAISTNITSALGGSY